MVHVSAGSRLRDIRTGKARSVHQDIIRNPATPLPLDDELVNGAMFELIPNRPDTLGLIDGYPRLLRAVDGFVKAARRRNHRLIGCVSLELSLGTSLRRIAGRGIREGEKLYDESLENYTRKRYQDHSDETMKAIKRISTVMPLVRLSAEGNSEEVWKRFSNAIGELVTASGNK